MAAVLPRTGRPRFLRVSLQWVTGLRCSGPGDLSAAVLERVTPGDTLLAQEQVLPVFGVLPEG